MLQDLIKKYHALGIVRQIITINVVLFLFSMVLFYQYKLLVFDFPSYVSFNSDSWFLYFWTTISYAFFHNGVIHLVLNMLFLYMFSSIFFTFFNEKQFLRIYIFGIFFSVIAAFIIKSIIGLPHFSVVGSSGVVSFIFFAIARFSPSYRIYLFIISLEIWILAGIYFLIFISLIYSGDGGNLVHLSGAVGGILWGYFMRKGKEISGFLQYVFDHKNLSQKEKQIKKVYQNSNSKKLSTKNSDQTKVDTILDKISKNGYDNLTDEEKKFLFQFKDK